MSDRTVDHWLSGAGRYPLLTANQEITLGEDIAAQKQIFYLLQATNNIIHKG
jgi:hypothetical protein